MYNSLIVEVFKAYVKKKIHKSIDDPFHIKLKKKKKTNCTNTHLKEN